MLRLLTVLLLLLFSRIQFCHAQIDSLNLDIYKASFSELSSLKVSDEQDINVVTGAFKQSTLRESPSIITVITGEEIKHLGARDITDLIRFIPGFEVAKSDDHVLSMGVRGNWGGEFVMIDGNLLNEISYGECALFNRIPLENIERIEILRGPGSAIYGGFATLSVMNIITKDASQGEYAQAMFRYGNERGNTSRLSGQLSLNQKFKNDVSLSLSGWIQEGDFSQRAMVLPNGDVYEYANNSEYNVYNFNAKLLYKTLKISFIKEELKNYVTPFLYDWFTQGTFLDISNKFKLSNKWSLTPSLSIKNQKPANYANTSDSLILSFNNKDQRLKANMILSYTPNAQIDVTFGVEGFRDYSENDRPYLGGFSGGGRSISYHNFAAFGEFNYSSPFGNFTIGARMDDHSNAKLAFVPRFAYTKAFKYFHFKALYSFAFRAPTIQNINFASQELKPEKVRVGEIEIGYKKHHFSANINFFDISSKDPIIYINDPENDIYDFINQGKSGTKGIEGEIKHSGKWGFLVLNYSYYRAKKYSDNQDFKVDGNDKLFLGMPQHKASLRASFHLQSNIWINPSLNYSSERYYYLPVDVDYAELEQQKANPFLNTNLLIEYNDILKTGVDLSLGGYNLFNANTSYVSPTNSGIIYIPHQFREWVITVRYRVR
ncbi:MAG: hypothetical protein OHK0038_18310 [Flammeovirgaceae bacterium]